ncbi:hypothetical protein M0804_006540 [Polistes exclamans]|nr:hypothetical protein M0804_006540 [Polistes exclamans]
MFNVRRALTENEDYDLDEKADGTDDLDVTLPSTADAKITETDNEYSDVESASDSADYDKLFSPYTPTRVDMRSRMITENIFETRDSLHLRRDNLIVFTDLSGTPCDDGAKPLNKAKRLPKSEHLVLARAGVTNIGKYKLVIIPIKEQAENSTKFETLVEAIGALLSVTRERQTNYSGGKKPVLGKACCLGGRARLWKRGNVDLKKDSEKMLAGASAS